jgi:PAS domain S-box-containing protein
VLYWGLCITYVYLSFSRRFTERFLSGYISTGWLLAGLGTAFWFGFAGAGPILVAAVALVGLFYGVRWGLAVVGVGTVAFAVAGVLAANDVLPALRVGYPPEQFVALWVAQTATFTGVAALTALVQAAVLDRAQKASARARSFALAAELTDDAVAVCRADRTIEWVNDAFTRLTGYAQDEVAGRSPGAFLQGPGTSDDDRRAMRAALGEGQGFVIEVVNVHKDQTPYWVRVSVQPLRDASGAVVGFAGVQRDVTARRLRQELDALEASLADALVDAHGEHAAYEVAAERLATLSAVARVTIWREGAVGIEPIASRASPVERLARHATGEPLPPRELPAAGVVEEGAPSGACRTVMASLPLGLRAAVCIELVGHMPGREAVRARILGICSRLAQFVRRREEQERFEALFDHSPTMLLLLDGRGRVARYNERATSVWPLLTEGADASSLLGAPAELVSRALALGSGERVEGAWEVLSKREAGSAVAAFVEATFAAMPMAAASAHDARILLAARDATARHMAELALEHTLEEQARTLAEREVLLREVHHRVKNNLQIVSSLLAMQGDRTESEEARAALEHSGTRVRSMALVHQLLYGGKNLAYVDLAEYARVLAHELRSALDPRAELELELQPADVTIETAVPSALVLNELLTNAFKHGRSPDGVCRVRVEVSQTEAASLVRVHDQGPGLPAQRRSAASLGMKIVTALVKQVGGTLEVGKGEGGSFTLTIPKVDRLEFAVPRSLPPLHSVSEA